MKRLHILTLQALRLCQQTPQTTATFADALCICHRYAEQVVRFMRQQYLIVEVPSKGRRKFFRMAPEATYLPTTLSVAEKNVMVELLSSDDPHVQSTIYKLLLLAHA